MAHAGIGADVEGVHAVDAALGAGRVRELVVESGRSGRPDVAGLVQRARSFAIPVRTVDDVRPLAATDAPQGVVARCTPIPSLSIDEMMALVPVPALLVLDHIEDPRNVGAAARSAFAAGMTGLVVSHRRSAPIGATAFKAAAGALEHLPVAMISSIADAMRRFAKSDIWTVGLDGEAEASLFGLELLDRPVAICIGAEGSGLSRLVADRCDVLARIPMAGDMESLNASVASALACFEVARVRGWVS